MPLEAERDYYIYLLDYGWHEPLGEALIRNYEKMAEEAAEHDAVVIRGTRRVHFEDQVLSWHGINGEPAAEILPAILITNRHPRDFKQSPPSHSVPGEYDEVKMVLIPIKKYCQNSTEVVTLIEQIFSDIRNKTHLQDFGIAKEMKRNRGSAILDAIILEPNISGVGVDLKKLFNAFFSKSR